MSSSLRLTTAEALVRFVGGQRFEGTMQPLCGGAFAIFGHGNVAGLGPALAHADFPVRRAHNEQAMALAATAYAKARRRRGFMACTTSIGPGATNLVTAAATARVNRLPLLLLPGDTFASRRPDPVLQQLEDPSDPSRTANECLRPVSAYFDRIERPEQIISAAERAIQVLTDPVRCGPVTLTLPQDVQVEELEVDPEWLRPQVRSIRRPAPDPLEVTRAADRIRLCRRLVLIAGGGVRYSEAEAEVEAFARAVGAPLAETAAGRGSGAGLGARNLGGIGVCGTEPANEAVRQAEVLLVLGSRLSDFTTGSGALIAGRTLVHVNVDAHDAAKHGGLGIVADVARGVEALREALTGFTVDPAWTATLEERSVAWWDDRAGEPRGDPLRDGDVVDTIAGWSTDRTTVVAASGSIPGELQKRWRSRYADTLHLEYGYSCMGYEIAGALGTKLAWPDREVVALVGDGAYLMMNSELQTSVEIGAPIVVVVLDNRGFGCIHRLQEAVGGPVYSNLREGHVDFAAHAASLGAHGIDVATPVELEQALEAARRTARSTVIVVKTDPDAVTQAGGAWWDVPHRRGREPLA